MSESFWTSEAGLLVRLEDLSWTLHTQVYNNAIQVRVNADPALSIVEFGYVTEGDNRVCEDCSRFEGRRFRRGQFMPNLPRHPGCRCYWDLQLAF